MKGTYEIVGGKLKLISDEYFHGSVKENGKYVDASRSIKITTDENGNECVKIGINSFEKMEEDELPKNPEEPKNPEKDPDEDPEKDPEKDPDKDPDDPKNDGKTATTLTVAELKEKLTTLTSGADTDTADFEASYSLTEVHKETGTHTQTINYNMQIKAKGKDRYLKFEIGNLNEEYGISQGNSQSVEIWYVGGNTYIKAVTWQKVNESVLDKETNVIKASGQAFKSVCQNLSYPISSLLLMGSDLNTLLSDTSATATVNGGAVTYTLDCTGKSDALTALYRITKAFAVELASDKFNDAEVNYSLGDSTGLSVTYTASYAEYTRSATIDGAMNFKGSSQTITVPANVSAAEDVGAGYKSWYNSLEGITHR